MDSLNSPLDSTRIRYMHHFTEVGPFSSFLLAYSPFPGWYSLVLPFGAEWIDDRKRRREEQKTKTPIVVEQRLKQLADLKQKVAPINVRQTLCKFMLAIAALELVHKLSARSKATMRG